MADLGNLHFGVHLKDYTDAEADKIKKKLENLSVKLTIDGKNVNISHTDLIKKQIEDAVKSVSVQSVKVDTSAVKAQVTSALQGINPQISVTLLKGSLGNDLQNYLNSRTFNVGISISKSDAQNAARTAFANVSVPVNVTISASAVAQQMRQSLGNVKVKVGVEAKDVNTFIADVEKKLKGKKIKVDVEPNQQHLVQAVKQSLQGVSVKAQVKVDVDAQAITRAVQSAINNANFTYNPSGKGGRGGANANSAASSQRNLGNAYHYAAQGAYQSARASVSLGRSLSTNIRIAGELGTALGNLASIFGVKDLLYGIVQIGGQLENQRIALGAILQDGGKATEMFSKIQSLAVKSPFGIMDLNQYTKQLSAYGIEYNELYETMKRMADISAGVGVDMGRIILAFGQVKAAGFLKGTELRQFTEANIPMVEKLAEKFSLLEKRIVSAGEVYDMISEKKVTFEDVKDVLWGLTDEGGMFNNMQEVLSESLASKWKNLSDAIDVMYGKMADGMMGSGLKALAEGLTELTKNWQTLIGVIGGAGAAYAAYKMSVALGSGTEAMGIYKQIVANQQLEKSHLRVARTYRELSAAEKGALMSKTAFTTAELRQAAVSGALTKEMTLRLVAMKKISVAQAGHLKQILGITRAEIAHAAAVTKRAIAWGVFKNAILGVGAALKSLMTNPWTWVFAGISAIGSAVMNWKQKSDELKQITKEIQESAKGSMQTIGKELDKLRDLDVGKLNDDELKTQINELTTLIKNEAPHWQSLLADVFKKDADGNFVRTAKEQLDGLIEKIKEVYEAKQMLSDNSGVFSDALDKTDGWFFNDSLTKNLQDYSKEIGNVEDSIKNLGSFYSHIQTAITKAAGANQEFLKESDGKSIQEKVKILSKYKEEFKEFSKELGKTNQRALSIINDYLSALSNRLSTEEWEDAASDIKIFTDAIWKPLLDRGYTLSNLDEVAKQFIYDLGKRLVTNAGDINPTTIKDFWTEYLKNFGMTYEEFSVVPAGSFDKNKNNDKPKYDPSKDEVAKLWKKRAEEIDKAVKMYDKWKEVEGDINAESRVKGADEFSNLFNGKYGFSLNLENPTEAYRHIQKQLNKNLSAQNEVYIALGVKVSDAELNDAKEKVKRLIDDVKAQAREVSEQWDLYKQLFELTGNREFAKSAFDKTHVWDEAALKMKSGLENAMKELKLDFDADFDISDKDAKELYGELYDSWKAIKDRIEKNGIDLKVNTANAIKDAKDFEMQVEEIERELHEKLERIGKSGLSADIIGRLTQSLIEQSERAISSLEFDKFKKEVGYTQFFANLEHQGVHSILAMRDAMLKFGDSTNLSLEEMKQLADDIERMMDVLAKNHPFKAIDIAAQAWGELRKVYKTARENFEKNPSFANGIALAKAKADLDKADDVMLEAAKSIQSKFENLSGVVSDLSSMFERLGNTSLKHFAEELESISSGMDTGSGVGNYIGGLFGRGGAGSVVGGFIGAAAGAMVGLADAGRKAVKAEQERSQIVIDRLEKVASLLKDKIANSLTGLYRSTLDITSKFEMERQKEKYDEAKKYLENEGTIIDPNTWYSATFDTTSFSWDKNDYLLYSKQTHDAINQALESDNEFMAAYASMLAQRDELLYQKINYTDKDSDKVEAYKRDKQIEIEKLNLEIEEFSKDMMSSLYSIDFQDWAGQLADSIVNAWASGEDAAKAYEGTVSDIMRNVAASLVRQQIIGDYLNQHLKPFIDDFIGKNGLMDTEMFESLGAIVEGVGERTEDVLTFMDNLERVMNEKGLTLKDLSDDTSKSGLTKGIQSVTEDTADLLASYINGMRADLSMNRTLIEQLVSVDVPKMSYLAEAQLQQLQMVVSNTKRNADTADRIYELINKVVDKGSNKLKI